MILFEVFVESTHRVDVLLPDGKQDLDVPSLAHRLSKRGGKLARSYRSLLPLRQTPSA